MRIFRESRLVVGAILAGLVAATSFTGTASAAPDGTALITDVAKASTESAMTATAVAAGLPSGGTWGRIQNQTSYSSTSGYSVLSLKSTGANGDLAVAAPVNCCAGFPESPDRADQLWYKGPNNRLYNGTTWRVLAVSGASKSDGAKAVVWDDTGVLDQKWTFKSTGFGILSNANSGKCLGISGGSTAINAQVVQYRCDGTANQNWRFIAY